MRTYQLHEVFNNVISLIIALPIPLAWPGLQLMLFMCSGESLTVQAPGTQTRSFCYVSDMVCEIYYFLIY